MALLSSATDEAIRVLVVDDSAFMRRAIERLLAAQPGIVVVGSAADGIEAVQQTLELRPDVITMDVEMPRLDGLGAVREIMGALPTPIVMLSTRTTEGAQTTFNALDAGAVDFVAKPGPLSEDLEGLGDRLGDAIRGARQTRVQRRTAAVARPPHHVLT
ncbi:MAG: response regulator, partial [Tepidiformaceae bacterium]